MALGKPLGLMRDPSDPTVTKRGEGSVRKAAGKFLKSLNPKSSRGSDRRDSVELRGQAIAEWYKQLQTNPPAPILHRRASLHADKSGGVAEHTSSVYIGSIHTSNGSTVIARCFGSQDMSPENQEVVAVAGMAVFKNQGTERTETWRSQLNVRSYEEDLDTSFEGSGVQRSGRRMSISMPNLNGSNLFEYR